MELPDRVIAAAQICGWLPCGFLVALPFHKILPPPVVRFAVIQNGLEVPLLDLLSIVCAGDHTAAIGSDVLFDLLLPWNALIPAVWPNQRNMKGVEDPHVGWELESDCV